MGYIYKVIDTSRCTHPPAPFFASHVTSTNLETRPTLTVHIGCAIAHAVSCWLPTAAVGVRARVWSCGIYGWQSGARAGFLLPIFIPPIAPQSPSSIIRCCYFRSVVAAVPSGLSLTPLRIIKNVYICSYFKYLISIQLFVFVTYFILFLTSKIYNRIFIHDKFQI
jgi:hypothetical protein